MKFTLAFIALALCSSQAMAGQCSYVSAFNEGAIVLSGKTATLTSADGEAVQCKVNLVEEGTNSLACEGREVSPFTMAPATIDGTDTEELLVVYDSPWYRYCE